VHASPSGFAPPIVVFIGDLEAEAGGVFGIQY
jgi:hypothetical protein